MTEPRRDSPPPAVESEIKRLQAIIERDRTKYAEVMTKIKHSIEQRDWLTEGRGPYEWDDDDWHREFMYAGREILTALEPLEKIAGDLSDCPKTQAEVDEARASSPSSATEQHELGDPLYPLYEEYSANKPPKGQPLLTYSGWLTQLAIRLKRESATPKGSSAGTPEGK